MQKQSASLRGITSKHNGHYIAVKNLSTILRGITSKDNGGYYSLDCANNPEKSSTTKVSKHISSGFSIPKISSFKGIENKPNVYRGKDCMKKICESSKEHAMKIINFKNKEIKLLTNKQKQMYENAEVCYICNEKFEDKYIKDKKYCKVIDHCHYISKYKGAAHSIRNLKYNVPKRIPVVFHNGSNYGKTHKLFDFNRKRSYKN